MENILDLFFDEQEDSDHESPRTRVLESYCEKTMKDQPFLFPKFMEQVFFHEDRLKHG
jgi:hypothetical protein